MTSYPAFLNPTWAVFILSSTLALGLAPEGCGGGGDTDMDGDGYSPLSGDCDDSDPTVNPGAVEDCFDSIDNDCDGQVDECGVTPTPELDGTVMFLSPTTYNVTNPVTFTARVTGDVQEVEYLADGFSLGASADARSLYSVTYTFNSLGIRNIEALGRSASGVVVATDAMTLNVQNPASDTDVCFQGADGSYGTCLPTVPLGPPYPSGYSYPDCSSLGSTYSNPERALDLNVVDPDTRVAPNFYLDEFVQSYKGQYGIIQSHAVDRVQEVRDAVGPLIVNSGYRGPSYNASVGGASCSRHMWGDAFDLDPTQASLDALASACYGRDASYVQVYESHIHCDWRYDALDTTYYRGSEALTFDDLPILEAWVEAEGNHLYAPARGWDEGEPLREWRAYGLGDQLITQVRSRSFEVPEGAHRVEVEIGMVLTLHHTMN